MNPINNNIFLKCNRAYKKLKKKLYCGFLKDGSVNKGCCCFAVAHWEF